VNLLLDTHVWIWSQESPEKIGAATRDALVEPGNRIFLSTTSTLEIARLLSMRRVTLTLDLQAWVEESIRLLQADSLSISHAVAIEAYRLPDPFHRDPADRLLVATARVQGATLVTADDSILGYPHVATMDARN
jgi:PIN domain nuclease of toxin-antitoxin system